MESPEKRTVKITFVTGYQYPPVIGFDFGDFAILHTYDLLRAAGGFVAFYGEEHKNYGNRLSYELRYYSKRPDFSFCLSERVIDEVRRMFKNHQAVPNAELLALLESFTPRDILPLFFQKR